MTHSDVLLSELKAVGLQRMSSEEVDALALQLIDGAAQMVDPARFVPGRLLVTILEGRAEEMERRLDRLGVITEADGGEPCPPPAE